MRIALLFASVVSTLTLGCAAPNAAVQGRIESIVTAAALPDAGVNDVAIVATRDGNLHALFVEIVPEERLDEHQFYFRRVLHAVRGANATEFSVPRPIRGTQRGDRGNMEFAPRWLASNATELLAFFWSRPREPLLATFGHEGWHLIGTQRLRSPEDDATHIPFGHATTPASIVTLWVPHTAVTHLPTTVTIDNVSDSALVRHRTSEIALPEDANAEAVALLADTRVAMAVRHKGNTLRLHVLDHTGRVLDAGRIDDQVQAGSPLFSVTEAASDDTYWVRVYCISHAHGDSVYFLWLGAVTGAAGSDSKVCLATRAWNGVAGQWSDTRILDTRPEGGLVRPSMAIDPQGGLHVSWLARRPDARWEALYAGARDGRTFGSPLQVGPPFAQGHPGDARFMDADDNFVWVPWACEVGSGSSLQIATIRHRE